MQQQGGNMQQGQMNNQQQGQQGQGENDEVTVAYFDQEALKE